jgi:hypothetical protein
MRGKLQRRKMCRWFRAPRRERCAPDGVGVAGGGGEGEGAERGGRRGAGEGAIALAAAFLTQALSVV